MRNPSLRGTWMPAILLEIDGLIHTGAQIPCSKAGTIHQELLPILIQLKRKRLADQAGTFSKLQAQACISGNIERDQFGMSKDPSTAHSPNGSINTFLLFIAIAVKRRWEIYGADITVAYTMAPNNRKDPLYVYTYTPAVDKHKETKSLRLFR